MYDINILAYNLLMYLVLVYELHTIHFMRKILVSKEHHFYKFSYLLQTSDNTNVSNEYNRLFVLNAHPLYYMSSAYIS